MAVVAPKVEYYRLVDDGTSTGTFKFLDASTPATLLDFGTVDAGSSSNANKTTVDAATSNNDPGGYQAYAIFNAKGESTDHSDMQNAELGVVSNEAGHEGNQDGDVYTNHWVHVLLNTNPASKAVALDLASDGETVVKQPLTAIGVDASESAGVIKGTKNDGTLSGAQSNYARITTWVELQANAPAGPHYFRLRTTYQYT